jgi:hypothetical protein
MPSYPLCMYISPHKILELSREYYVQNERFTIQDLLIKT